MGEARDVMDRVTEAVVSKDLEALSRASTPRMRSPSRPDLGTMSGRDQIVAWLGEFVAAFPDASFETAREHACGDTAIDEGYFVGTNTGPLAMPNGESIPATGRRVLMRACDAATVEDGVVTATGSTSTSWTSSGSWAWRRRRSARPLRRTRHLWPLLDRDRHPPARLTQKNRFGSAVFCASISIQTCRACRSQTA